MCFDKTVIQNILTYYVNLTAEFYLNELIMHMFITIIFLSVSQITYEQLPLKILDWL